jgi:Uma2 family endonuclease
MPATLETTPAFGLLKFPLAEGLEVRLRPGLDLMTRVGFDALCEDNPDLRIERRGTGELTIDMPTKGLTGLRNALLATVLGVWALQKGERRLFTHRSGIYRRDSLQIRPIDDFARKNGIVARKRSSFGSSYRSERAGS